MNKYLLAEDKWSINSNWEGPKTKYVMKQVIKKNGVPVHKIQKTIVNNYGSEIRGNEINDSDYFENFSEFIIYDLMPIYNCFEKKFLYYILENNGQVRNPQNTVANSTETLNRSFLDDIMKKIKGLSKLKVI